MYRFLLFFLSCCVHASCMMEKTNFPLQNSPIDIVIPCHAKDRDRLLLVIKHAKRYIKNARDVYVISKEAFTPHAIWIDEQKIPFSHIFFGSTATHPIQKWGWTFQQLLKLYVFEIIPQISPNVLVLDADTIFLSDVTFVDEKGEAYYTTGGFLRDFYITFGKKLLPGFERFFPNESAICHHMLLQKPVMEDLLHTIEKCHHMKAWEAFLACYTKEYVPKWAADLPSTLLEVIHPSEFELYFHFAFARTSQVHLRPLKWKDLSAFSLRNIRKHTKKGYHFVSNHHWLDKKPKWGWL